MKDSPITNRSTWWLARRTVGPGRSPSTHRAVRRACAEALEGRWLMSFSPAVAFPVGAIPEAVLTDDFNGDGRLDLAVANYFYDSTYGSTVSVLLGNADGTFQPQRVSPTGLWPVSLAVGDFDADGKLDLATADSVSGVSVLPGNGDGTFAAPTNIDLGGYPTSVAVGDFDADGNLDLGVTLNVVYGDNYSTSLASNAIVLLGHGDGTFAPPSAAPLGGGWRSTTALADFNSDGNLDFATAGGSVDVVFGDGTGALGSPLSMFETSVARSVIAEDVNADGAIDLVTANEGDTVSVRLGSGLGTFGAARDYPVGTTPYTLATADFNGDGKVDLVTANESAGTVSVLFGTGTGSFGAARNFAVGFEPQSLAAGDFNGDLLADLAVANQRSDSVSVLINRQPWPADDAPSVSIGDATVAEGNTGTVGATFTVSLSAPYDRVVTVDYASADGSATAGEDYQAASGTLAFGIGETSKTLTVMVNGDRLAEDAEFFQVRLGNPVNTFFLTDSTGLGDITDDEPHISIYGEPVTEGNTGTRAALFTVSLDREYDADVTVGYSTVDGTAEAGSDYQPAGGTLTIPAGQTSRTFTVLVNGDRVPEQTEYHDPYSYVDYNEYFSVYLSSSANATVEGGHRSGVILDDEPRISVNTASVTEGDRGTKLMTFTVNLSAVYDQAVTVRYATQDSSALAGTDYTAASGTLTFAAGQTARTFTVAIRGDREVEWSETFLVRLTNASINASIGQGDGYGTIVDDDRRRKSKS